MKLNKKFYLQPDVVELTKKMLGKQLFTRTEDGIVTGGMIVEAEAYDGTRDKASHAYKNKKTKRTEVMFRAGGLAYVYLCYGIHSLFNIITNIEGIPHAILIRAIEPVTGEDVMLERRGMSQLEPRLTAGPGVLSKALGIDRQHYGLDLTGNTVWLEDKGVMLNNDDIIASARVGVDYAEEDARLPWRFRIRDNKWTSPAK